ncbi:MAG: allophanate hydrolase subunit 1, partial [Propionibacteriaceae bacterium]|nr:allophanate hydrolase subunit 1 [Propionibacteriaceae bacterium]
MRVLAVGSRALLVEVDSLGAVLALHAALLAARPAGVIDVVAAARTVLVSCTDADAAATARALVDTLDLSAAPQRDETLVEVRVLYDGADLEAVANLTGLSVEAVIAAHTGQTWTAAFGGFAPGFTYCVGEHHALDVPRRATPRTAVPAGAVGLAGEFSAV